MPGFYILNVLQQNPILVLFVVIVLGYLLGKIRIGNFSLGIAAVLFAGLGVSALDPKLMLPQIVYILGLVLFIYTLGLSAGPAFVAALHNRGVRDNLFAICMVSVGGIILVGSVLAIGIHGPIAGGIYAGTFNSTPALAAVLESLKGTSNANAPVVGYALTYPVGLLAVLAAIAFFERRWHISYQTNSENAGLHVRTLRVTRKDSPALRTALENTGANVSISRIDTGKQIRTAHPEDVAPAGTLVSVVGTMGEIRKLAAYLGQISDTQLQYDRRILEASSVFVSNPKMIGRTVRSLRLRERYDVVITRMRRGDTNLVVHDDTVLELGDRIRMVGVRDQVYEASKLFGDSYRSVSEFNVLTLTLGICLGLLIGSIPVPLPGGHVFHLGFAGGPLLVSLTLGALGKTGPLVWQLPFSTGVAIRQMGLMVFLAAIGTQAGSSLGGALSDPSSLMIVLAGGLATATMAILSLIIGYKYLHVPFPQLSGIVSGIQTQPAVLAFASERSHSDKTAVGYTTVYPVVMIVKILVVQIVLLVAMKGRM